MKLLKVILSISIFLAALFGDYIVFRSKFSHSQVFRAISDSIVHATLGGLSSILFFSHGLKISLEPLVWNVAFCTFMSSCIDIDHIFVARSVYWKDYVSLKQRGLFHCTTFWLMITITLLVYSILTKKNNIYLLTWMLILAFSSHHLRDANRRGLWLYPFGHTPALSKYTYSFLVAVLPNVFASFYFFCIPQYKKTTLEYSLV